MSICFKGSQEKKGWEPLIYARSESKVWIPIQAGLNFTGEMGNKAFALLDLFKNKLFGQTVVNN